MQHVIFEVLPAPGARDAYLATAARLKPLMEASGGCLTLERFDRDDGHGMLSMQKWADEAALARWRAEGSHRAAMNLGRERLFEHYRLRVAQSLRFDATREGDAGLPGAPAQGLDLPLDGELPRAVAVLEWTEGAAPLPALAGEAEGLRYTAILDPSRHALVTATADGTLLAGWCARLAPRLRAAGIPFALSLAAVARDYGPRERAEAPAA